MYCRYGKGPYKPFNSNEIEINCAETETNGQGGKCYFVDSTASNNWIAHRVRNATSHYIFIQSFGLKARSIATYDGNGVGVFKCLKGDLCANELYRYGDIVSNESYPVMTNERWSMVNEYKTTEENVLNAMRDELKEAYCSSRKVDVDRMGC